MPRRTPSPNLRNSQPLRSSRSQPVPGTPETVDPRWILKAVVVVVLAALICGYLSLCLLFYIGQWQIVLHPKRTSTHPDTLSGTPIQFFSFAPDDSAVPQLTGWLIPAAPSSRYSTTTLLYLPSGDGSLANATVTLTVLHNLGVNVFAVDYRGYGQSSTGTHPSQKILFEDAESAWQYLHTSRSLTDQQIIPYGVGVGASLATHLATNHPNLPAIVLESPYTDLLAAALKDDRTKLVPARLLFHELFPMAAPLSSLHTPKLLLSGTRPPAAFQNAAEPRITVELEALPGFISAQPGFIPSITRFLDQYLPPASAPQLILTPASPQR